jgi:hypothetical protein
MFDGCCSHQSEFIKDKLDYKAEEIDKGIRIEGVRKILQRGKPFRI